MPFNTQRNGYRADSGLGVFDPNAQRFPWETSSPFGTPGSASLMMGGGAPPTAGGGMGSALYQLAMQQGGPNPGGGMPNLMPATPYGTKPPPNMAGGMPLPGQGMGDRIMGGIGDFLGGNDGANALMLGSTALNAYDAHRQRQEYERDRRRREELEDEQRRRYDSNAGARTSLLGDFTGRL